MLPAVTRAIPYLTSRGKVLPLFRLRTIVSTAQNGKTSHNEVNEQYNLIVSKSWQDCQEMIQTHDKYSNLISRAYPSHHNHILRDFFLATKAFQLELNKIAISGSNSGSISDNMSSLKYDFWKGKIEQIFNEVDNKDSKNYNQPVLNILNYCNKSQVVPPDSKLLFLRMISGYQDFGTNIIHKGYDDLSEACLFGERTYSSLNYLLFNSLSYNDKFINDIFAIEDKKEIDELKTLLIETYNHLGQSQYLSNLLISLKFYAKSKNVLLIPVDVSSKYNMSQEEITRLLLTGEGEKMSTFKDIIFEISVLANDHLITAEQKFGKVKSLLKEVVQLQPSEDLNKTYKSLKDGIPDCIYLPMLNHLSSAMFLRELEAADFDLVNRDFSTRFYWKFPFKCYYNYTNRRIR